MSDHFQIVVLGPQRKFLNNVKVSTPEEAGRVVSHLLTNAVVETVSIKRVVKKEPTQIAG